MAEQSQEHSHRDLIDFLDRIRKPWENIRSHHAKENETSAIDFNIFRALEVERRELSHSAFLAELLNPNGSHGQGYKFLRNFLFQRKNNKDELLNLLDTSSPETKWSVETEKYFTNGRMDIVLTGCTGYPENSILIVIENKIDADLDEEQLKRYWDWMESQQHCFHHRLLFCLTVTDDMGDKPGAKTVPYTRLSYLRDIKSICENTAKSIAAERVRNTVEQYIEVISRLNGRHRVMTQYEKEREKLLKERENLLLALEIGDMIPDLKRNLIRTFWKDIITFFKEKIQYELTDKSWELDERRQNVDFLRDWHGIDLFDSPSKEQRPKVMFSLSLVMSSAQFYYGVTTTEPENPNIPDSLKLLLKNMQCDRQNEFIGCKKKDLANLNTFIISIAHPSHQCPAKVDKHEIWGFFLGVKDEIVKANRLLRDGQS